jgi:hypothetical protein
LCEIVVPEFVQPNGIDERRSVEIADGMTAHLAECFFVVDVAELLGRRRISLAASGDVIDRQQRDLLGQRHAVAVGKIDPVWFAIFARDSPAVAHDHLLRSPDGAHHRRLGNEHGVGRRVEDELFREPLEQLLIARRKSDLRFFLRGRRPIGASR